MKIIAIFLCCFSLCLVSNIGNANPQTNRTPCLTSQGVPGMIDNKGKCVGAGSM